MEEQHTTRRRFIRTSLGTIAGAATLTPSPIDLLAREATGDRIGFGLVTWQWGAKWKLPELLKSCEAARCLGVELRTTHAHGVEISLDEKARADVKKRFADSPVTLVGIGSNERYDNPDPAVVRKAIEATKKFVVLSHDVGGSGVKVKPDRFHPDVPREKTIEQIGKSLLELGKFAESYGQQIRLEVHGQCSELPITRQIIDHAKHPNVVVCWNSNAADLTGKGLEHNFGLVSKRLGKTAHVRRLDAKGYPWAKLFELFVGSDYDGWIMIEDPRPPKDVAAELVRQRAIFDDLLSRAKKVAGSKKGS